MEFGDGDHLQFDARLRTPSPGSATRPGQNRSTCGFRGGRSPAASLPEAARVKPQVQPLRESSRIAQVSSTSSPSRRPPGNSRVKPRTAGAELAHDGNAPIRGHREHRDVIHGVDGVINRAAVIGRSDDAVLDQRHPGGEPRGTERRRCAEKGAHSKSSRRSSPVPNHLHCHSGARVSANPECRSAHKPRFRVRCFAPPRNDDTGTWASPSTCNAVSKPGDRSTRCQCLDPRTPLRSCEFQVRCYRVLRQMTPKSTLHGVVPR